MRKSRFTTEQIIGFIKQAEAGMAVAELGRQHGFSPASFYAWRAKYGGMEAEPARDADAAPAGIALSAAAGTVAATTRPATKTPSN